MSVTKFLAVESLVTSKNSAHMPFAQLFILEGIHTGYDGPTNSQVNVDYQDYAHFIHFISCFILSCPVCSCTARGKAGWHPGEEKCCLKMTSINFCCAFLSNVFFCLE